MGILDWLFILFVTLKFTHVIDWSWWLVTLPLWGVGLLALIIGAKASK